MSTKIHTINIIYNNSSDWTFIYSPTLSLSLFFCLFLSLTLSLSVSLPPFLTTPRSYAIIILHNYQNLMDYLNMCIIVDICFANWPRMCLFVPFIMLFNFGTLGVIVQKGWRYLFRLGTALHSSPSAFVWHLGHVLFAIGIPCHLPVSIGRWWLLTRNFVTFMRSLVGRMSW